MRIMYEDFIRAPKSEDNLHFVERKRLLEGAERKQSENLQGGVVEI